MNVNLYCKQNKQKHIFARDKILLLSRIAIQFVMIHVSYWNCGNIVLQNFDVMQINEVYLSIMDLRDISVCD